MSLAQDRNTRASFLGKVTPATIKVPKIKRLTALLISSTSLLIKAANYQAETCHLLIKFKTHFPPTDTR